MELESLRYNSPKVSVHCDPPIRKYNNHVYRISALGAKVIAAASPAKLSVTRDYGGADFAIDYTKKGWQQEVMKITGGHGVDVVYDPVGMIRGKYIRLALLSALQY